jgi:RNA polymerase sigma-70 factor (ECF subfamily)
MKGRPQPRREAIPSADVSRGAVDHLFQSESTQLRRYFRFKTGDRDGAADLVQDAFVKMMEAPAAEIRNPAAYLQRIARNLIVDWFRDRRSKPHSEGVPLHECDAAIAAPQEDLSLFEDAVRGLSDKTRTVFLLKRVEGLTYEQIAKRLSISAKTVEYHMAQAFAHIDRFLEE